MKHICFVIHQYANPVQPYAMDFVRQLALSISDRNIKVTVISPLPVNVIPQYISVPYHIKERSENGNEIDVYFPKTVGFGQSHYFFGKSPVGLTVYFMKLAANKVIRKLPDPPDVYYGHFLAPSGVTAAKLGKKYKCPVFIACGEAHDTIGQYGAKKMKDDLSSVYGTICVSTALKDYLLKNSVIEEEKIAVIPNGYNPNRFSNIEKSIARKMLNLPDDVIIASFIGAFNERKGILRVCEAIERLNGRVKLICAGIEEQKPFGQNVLITTHLQPEEVAPFYYASDFFVLPTLAEGCCNAIVEAIACGLPIISSNLPFNDDILSDEYSIRIDPTNVDELENAILKLAGDPILRRKMANAAKEKAKELTLDKRTENILQFMQDMIESNGDK